MGTPSFSPLFFSFPSAATLFSVVAFEGRPPSSSPCGGMFPFPSLFFTPLRDFFFFLFSFWKCTTGFFFFPFHFWNRLIISPPPGRGSCSPFLFTNTSFVFFFPPLRTVPSTMGSPFGPRQSCCRADFGPSLFFPSWCSTTLFLSLLWSRFLLWFRFSPLIKCPLPFFPFPPGSSVPFPASYIFPSIRLMDCPLLFQRNIRFLFPPFQLIGWIRSPLPSLCEMFFFSWITGN